LQFFCDDFLLVRPDKTKTIFKINKVTSTDFYFVLISYLSFWEMKLSTKTSVLVINIAFAIWLQPINAG